MTCRKSTSTANTDELPFHPMFRSHCAVMLLVESESGAIIDANTAAEKFYGYSHESLLGMTIVEISVLDSNEIHNILKNSCLVEGGCFELKQKIASGEVRMVEVYSSPIILQGASLLFLIIHDITARKLAEEERQENLLFIEELLKNASVGIRVFDGETGRCILLNQTAADIAGGDVSVMRKQYFRELVSWQASGLQEVAEAVLSDGCTRMVKTDMLTSFGKQVYVEYIISCFLVKTKPHLLVIGRDITVEKQLADKNKNIEEQMLHVQKLESLGVMAGGIAHDFNNILLAILGNAELALMRLVPESPVRSNLQQIEIAAQRAADLAQQMLAYSGKGQFIIERLDINALITEMNTILEVSVSKKAAMQLNLAATPLMFEGDATQIRQIIMNLVINASEAIGDGNGVIEITTGYMNCDQACLSKVWHYDKLEEGVYVYFEIADTGCGMDHETVNKIFDPFFTTKFTGRGLGMAAVLGIVRGHHGAVTVFSEPGKGTRFKVFLPAKMDPGE